jgi:hypothetical protein
MHVNASGSQPRTSTALRSAQRLPPIASCGPLLKAAIRPAFGSTETASRTGP